MPDIDVGAFIEQQHLLADGSAAAREMQQTLGKFGVEILWRSDCDTTTKFALHPSIFGWEVGIAIEIWWYKREDDNYVYPGGGAGPYCHKFFEERQEVTLTAGSIVTRIDVPIKGGSVLKAVYGPGWTKPITIDTKRDDVFTMIFFFLNFFVVCPAPLGGGLNGISGAPGLLKRRLTPPSLLILATLVQKLGPLPPARFFCYFSSCLLPQSNKLLVLLL